MKWRHRTAKFLAGIGGGALPPLLPLLYDDFSVDRAAGTIDQTLTDPDGVGGLRTVVDTGDAMGISSGILEFSPAPKTGGDPAIWWDSIQREPGRLLKFTGINSVYFGFDSTQSGWASNSPFWRLQGGVLYARNASSVDTVRIASKDSAIADYTLSLRETGAFHCITVDDDTSLLFVSSHNNTQTLYPFVNHYSDLGGSEVDQIAIPQTLWAPTPIAADTGTSADVAGTYYTDGGTLTGIEAGGDGETWNGATWSNGVDGAKNTPALGINLFVDGGLENWVNSTNLTSWTEIISGSSTVQRTTDSNSGTYAATLVVDGSNSNVAIYQSNPTSTGDWVQASAYVKSGAGDIAIGIKIVGNMFLAGAYSFDVPANYTRVMAIGRNGVSTGSSIQIARNAASGQTMYVDDISIKVIPTADLFRSITTGTTPYIYAKVEGTLGDGVQAGSVLMLDDKDDPQNFVIVYHDGTSCIADKCVAGVYTNLFIVAAAEVPGVLPTASTRDNGDGTAQLWVWYDGAYIADMEVADAGIIGNTLYGEFSTSDTNRITHFLAYDTGGHTPPGA